MRRHCNGKDPNLRTIGGLIGNCGKVFNDVDHWTICPHLSFSPTVIPTVSRETEEDHEPVLSLLCRIQQGRQHEPCSGTCDSEAPGQPCQCECHRGDHDDSPAG